MLGFLELIQTLASKTNVLKPSSLAIEESPDNDNGTLCLRKTTDEELKDLTVSYLLLQAKLGEKFQELEETEKRLGDRVDNLEEDLELSSWALQESRKQNAALQDRLDDALKELSRLPNLERRFEAELAQKTIEVEQSQQTISDLETELMTTNQENSKLDHLLKRSNEDVEAKLDQKEKELQTSRDRIRMLEAKLNGLNPNSKVSRNDSITSISDPDNFGSKIVRRVGKSRIRCPGYLSETLMVLLGSADNKRSVANVQALLRRGADVDCHCSNNMTPLTYVSSVSYMLDYARVMLENGANPNLKTQIKGKTPLMKAAEGGAVDIAQLLLEYGAEINESDSFGKTALIAAAEQKHLHVAELLIDAGADVNRKDDQGFTALHYSSKNGDDDMVRLLLNAKNNSSSLPADVSAKAKNGQTPLTLSANSKSVKRLLQSALKDLYQ